MKLKLDANFGDLLSAFRACNVRYLIIGGWAVSIHAQSRATQDMRIFVSPDRANIEALYEALLRFGAPLKSMDKSQLLAGLKLRSRNFLKNVHLARGHAHAEKSTWFWMRKALFPPMLSRRRI